MHSRFYLNGSLAEVRRVASWLVCLAGIFTPRSEVGRGQARRLMTMITEEADGEGLAVYLEFSPGGRSDPIRLKKLYREFGFVDATEMTPYRWKVLRRTIGPCYRDSIMYRPPSPTAVAENAVRRLTEEA